jgi:hypothetical protein
MRGVGRAVRPESAAFDSSGIGVWRAPMRRRGAISEKFFCCKNFDSESVRHPSERSFECFDMSIVQPHQYRE